jgi:hypothetical protein
MSNGEENELKSLSVENLYHTSKRIGAGTNDGAVRY